MTIEFLQGLNVNPVPVIIICFISWILRVSFIDKLIAGLPDRVRSNLVFAVPFIVSALVSVLWVKLDQATVKTAIPPATILDYLQMVLVNWCFASFVYKIVKNFIPQEEKDAK